MLAVYDRVMSAFVSDYIPEEIVIMFVTEVMIDDWLVVVDIAIMEVDTAVDVITFRCYSSETIHMK